MNNYLEVSIPDSNAFYTLYADGKPVWKTYDKKRGANLFYYAPGSIVILYYTYRTYREACIIRNVQNDESVFLPSLSKKTVLLFRVHASKVDKLKRAAGWLKEHAGGPFVYDDGFYIRLFHILQRRGKINYPALRKLAEK